jgi:predicted molibdopterin-dependent oxidoreductase YjgC
MTRGLVLDGIEVEIEADETLLTLAARRGRSIPSLCHDPRLEPAGVCRTCLVEVEGWRRLAPACSTPAAPGMVVHTDNERVRRHRRALFALYLSDHPRDAGECENGSPCELHRWALEVDAPVWPSMEPLRAGRPDDTNPYIHFFADRCILCARCTRYCDQVEGVSAITLAARGVHTTVSTVDGISLLDSACELCGGCVDVCPTGAMVEKMPLAAGAKPEQELEKVRTTCNFCGVGCQMDLHVDRQANAGRGKVVRVTSPPPGTPPNDGNLCVKGRFAYSFIDHPDRLTMPLVRGADGQLQEASWDQAIARAATDLLAVKERYGSDALGFVSSSRCTGEENYLVQKLARAVFGTNNVHQCAAT